MRFFLLLFLGISLYLAGFSSVEAQEAKPVPAVEEETLLNPDALVVIELFSSQACIFCPKADQLFADLVRQDNVIGLACHVDYFDVKQGALSKSFCSQRQSWYGKTLHTGPNYTPQMVLQGQIDVVGYKGDDVKGAVGKAALKNTPRFDITPAEEADTFRVAFPKNVAVDRFEKPSLWIALYDKPHEIVVAEGRNKGKAISYYNITDTLKDMGPWHDGETAAVLRPGLQARHGGFVVLLQDMATGELLAAGDYKTF